MNTERMNTELLRMQDVCIAYGNTEVVHGISFHMNPGGVFCLAGESGSGKSTVLKAILGLPAYLSDVTSGSIRFRGRELPDRAGRERPRLLGTEIGMVQQNPAASFNPIRTFEKQYRETLTSHGVPFDTDRIVGAFRKMNLPADISLLKRCPYEVSGGMNQRLAIALMMLLQPRLLLCDEVTSALDVTTQKQVADELLALRDETGLGILLVTHNLGLAARMADNIGILHGGTLVESGPVRDVLGNPQADYTKELIRAVPDLNRRLPEAGPLPRPCPQAARQDSAGSPAAAVPAGPGGPENAAAPLLRVDGAVRRYRVNGTTVDALNGVSLTVNRGEVLGIVGESGSGKSTLLRHIACLERLTEGTVTLDGRDITKGSPKAVCAELQMVFQDTYASFDPRMTVQASLRETARAADRRRGVHRCRDETDADILRLVGRVGLAENLLARLPSRLSGGQCQRMAIARAVSAKPELLLCDEATSALDVTAQEEVLKLLAGLRREYGLTILFVSHDIAVVHSLCDRVLVLKDGKIVEQGPVDRVIHSPRETYTKELMASVLTLEQS